ncbi:ABC transporter ATP-binding protein [Spelaeicoccus albus]|uniref:ABC-type multidrug transport system ATPase subunit n=1 Tax=Spelaeicoccus albus TaxID=1280376 RepID=A0A7Z0D2L8_9MICO|nr:ABC transporter ATP-binding protein [Spelaeicoccus albus]NYI67725.1 ABC-type multidrug transport system ATPase subunit [Spelaeicoccus albus]
MKTRNILSAAKKKNYVIEVSELLVGYNQGTVCGELNFEVEAGDVLSLIGANGVGKTTVLKALIGLLEPEEGAVKLFGRPVDDRELWFRRDVASVLDEDAFFPSLSVAEHLILMAKGHAVPNPEDAVIAELETFGLTARAEALPSELSSGQRRRMLLASAFLRPFKLLVLDEPEQRLDPSTRIQLGERLRALGDAGTAIVMATHDGELMSAASDWAILIGDEPESMSVDDASEFLGS